MKWWNLLLAFVGLALLVSCGSIVQDTALAPIEYGQKRVETSICNREEVGENGCVFPNGELLGELKIFKIYDGQVEIKGLGCGVDHSESYSYDQKDPWLHLDLQKLIGPKIQEDCVLTIVQKVRFKGADEATFAFKNLIGTVTLGTCPAGVLCSMNFEQLAESQILSPLIFDQEAQGRYLLSGCGRELARDTFSGTLSLPLGSFLSRKADTGCMFILAARGAANHKVYHKVWNYSDKLRNLPLPEVVTGAKYTYLTVDKAVILTTVDGYIVKKNRYEASPEGNTVRFYTSQGRTLVVFILNGEIVWTK